MDSLYIVIPAYNEMANIKNVVEDWYKILDEKDNASKLVIADSGSTDSTHQILINLKEKYPKLEILENTRKEHGPKIIALYDYAIKNNADYIFQTDADGQTNPAEFNNFWEARKDYTGIFGCRNNRGDGKFRAFVERVVCAFLYFYFGIKVPDANAPYRLMKTESVKKYLHNMEKDYALPNIMMTAYFVYYHEKFKFVDISFKPRQGGKNSINFKKIVLISLKTLVDFKKFKNKMK